MVFLRFVSTGLLSSSLPIQIPNSFCSSTSVSIQNLPQLNVQTVQGIKLQARHGQSKPGPADRDEAYSKCKFGSWRMEHLNARLRRIRRAQGGSADADEVRLLERAIAEKKKMIEQDKAGRARMAEKWALEEEKRVQREVAWDALEKSQLEENERRGIQ